MEKGDLKLLQKKVMLLRSEGKYKETIEACYYLLNWGRERRDYKSILVAYMNYAASYYSIGNIEEAFNSIEAYRKICIQYGDEEDYLKLYNVLFLLYEYVKHYDQAKATLEKSINLGKKLKKYNIISNGYSNYSHVCMCENNYPEALNKAKIGLEMAKLHVPASPILEIRVKLNIAKAFIGLGNFTDSRSYIDEILHAPILDSYVREKAQCYDLQGFWYANQNLYREAFDCYTYAKNKAESYDDIYLLKEIQEERCKLCEQLNDFQLGFFVQKEYILLLNELSKRELALSAQKLEIKYQFAMVERQARTDYLTGLYNRFYLETTVNQWLKTASEKKESIVCIVFDIDNFKLMNDEHGHLFGDEVLRQVGKACSKLSGRNHLISRYGGDEFVVVLRRTHLENGKQKAEQIKEALLHLTVHNDRGVIPVRISMGIADNGEGVVDSFHELFYLADAGLYQAKRKGKNQIHVAR